MMQRLPIDIESVKGFLDPLEGEALYRNAFVAAGVGTSRSRDLGSRCGSH
jgi:hypothetical protein